MEEKPQMYNWTDTQTKNEKPNNWFGNWHLFTGNAAQDIFIKCYEDKNIKQIHLKDLRFQTQESIKKIFFMKLFMEIELEDFHILVIENNLKTLNIDGDLDKYHYIKLHIDCFEYSLVHKICIRSSEIVKILRTKKIKSLKLK